MTLSPRSLLLALLLTLLPTLPLRALESSLPEIGQPAGSVMTPVEEARLGEAFMRELRRTEKLLDEPLLQDLIQQLGGSLTAHPETLGHNFHFFLVDAPSVNAFAGPGGWIGVHSGLVLITQTESELTSVLAHEISHVTQKHLLRAFDDAEGSGIAMAATILAAVLVGVAADSPDAAIAAATAGQAALIQQRINFTRANEKEADNLGMAILADTGFDPNGMPDFFERLSRTTRYYDLDKVPEFLMTHPVTTNRIAESRARAVEYPYRQVSESLAYHLLWVSLKLREFDEPVAAVRYFRDSLKDGRYRNETAQRYGLARALELNGELEAAGAEYDRLLKQRDLLPALVLGRAGVSMRLGQSQQAVSLLQDAQSLYPGNRPLLIALAETLLELDRPQDARRLLQDHVGDDSSDVRLYQLLAQAAGGSGLVAEGQGWRAEALYHAGELKQAARQLELALENTRMEYFQSARLSARLREINREIRDQEQRSDRP